MELKSELISPCLWTALSNKIVNDFTGGKTSLISTLPTGLSPQDTEPTTRHTACTLPLGQRRLCCAVLSAAGVDFLAIPARYLPKDLN